MVPQNRHTRLKTKGKVKSFNGATWSRKMLWLWPAKTQTQRLRGRGMLPVITKHLNEEPTIPVTINEWQHYIMVDKGTTYSCIGSESPSLPLSQALVKTVSFLGKKQVKPLTEPVLIMIVAKVIHMHLFYTQHKHQSPCWVGHAVLTQRQNNGNARWNSHWFSKSIRQWPSDGNGIDLGR